LFFKQRGFEHEREVRAAIVPAFLPDENMTPLGGMVPPPSGGGTSGVVTFSVSKDCVPDLRKIVQLPDKGGLRVPVDVTTLMERIVVSPRYPGWAVAALQEIVYQSGLLIYTENSALQRKPI
jgi:hypothetical protein